MIQKFSMVAAATMLTVSVANAGTIQLQPIPDAFARLGHSCGGIRQQIFAVQNPHDIVPVLVVNRMMNKTYTENPFFHGEQLFSASSRIALSFCPIATAN